MKNNIYHTAGTIPK